MYRAEWKGNREAENKGWGKMQNSQTLTKKKKVQWS